MDLKKIVKLIESELYRFSEIEFAYLFGSVLKKDLAKAEDVDIAIFFKDSLSAEKIIQKKIKLESLLSIKLGKEIEISPLNFSSGGSLMLLPGHSGSERKCPSRNFLPVQASGIPGHRGHRSFLTMIRVRLLISS